MSLIKRCWSIVIIGLFATLVYADDTQNLSPTGYWKTIDDITGKPQSIIHIWRAADNTLSGSIVKVFPKNGGTPKELCTACKGEQHNKPIVGMVILSGLKSKKNYWDDGKVLDPQNGKFYSCSLQVADSGKKLNVHGYIGVSLLGRSQIWERVDLMADK